MKVVVIAQDGQLELFYILQCALADPIADGSTPTYEQSCGVRTPAAPNDPIYSPKRTSALSVCGVCPNLGSILKQFVGEEALSDTSRKNGGVAAE